METTFFAPRVSDDHKVLYNGFEQGHLMLRRCLCCGRTSLPVTHFCPDCLDDQFAYFTAVPHGIVYSYVVFRRAFHPKLEGVLPYITAVITLDCGEKVVSNIINCLPEEVTCDAEVRGVFCDDDTGVRVLRFELAK